MTRIFKQPFNYVFAEPAKGACEKTLLILANRSYPYQPKDYQYFQKEMSQDDFLRNLKENPLFKQDTGEGWLTRLSRTITGRRIEEITKPWHGRKAYANAVKELADESTGHQKWAKEENIIDTLNEIEQAQKRRLDAVVTLGVPGRISMERLVKKGLYKGHLLSVHHPGGSASQLELDIAKQQIAFLNNTVEQQNRIDAGSTPMTLPKHLQVKRIKKKDKTTVVVINKNNTIKHETKAKIAPTAKARKAKSKTKTTKRKETPQFSGNQPRLNLWA